MTEVTALFQRHAPWMSRLDHYAWPNRSSGETRLAEIAETIWSRRGKRLRPHLVYWFGELLGVPAESLHLYAWAAEAVHTATLLHDDVVDQATRRRGGPSANAIHDNTLPVISGDFLLSEAIHRLAREGSQAVLVALCETLKELCAGECLQYEMRFKIADSLQTYQRIANAKTASLFRWCALVAPTLRASPLVPVIDKSMRAFGVLFQCSDDMLDVVGTQTKPRWSDLREGKLNFATWQLLERDPELRRETTRAFQQKKISESLVQAFETSAASVDSISKIRQRLEREAESARALIRLLPDSPVRTGLEDLIRFCVERSY